MKVSAVICHHKGRMVLDCIKSIALSKNVEVEIILVTSEKNFVPHHCKVIHSNDGPSGKRNLGVKIASHDLIAFFDDDVEVTPNCIYEMTKLFKNIWVGMVYGKTLNAEKRDHFDCAGSFLTPTGFMYAREQSGIRDEGQFDKEERILSGKSASCMVKREAFGKAGLFDPSYGILGEETDLSWRIWLSGYEVMWAPKSVAYHWFNTSKKTPDFYTHQRVYFNGCRNYISMLYTNLEWRNLWIIPIHIFLWFVASCGMFLSGKRTASLNILKGIYYFVTHIPKKKRKEVQKMRKISDKGLFKILMKKFDTGYFIKRMIRYFKVGLHG